MTSKLNRTQDIVIIGCGGHAKVVLECIRSQGIYNPIGCITKNDESSSHIPIPILGDDNDVAKIFKKYQPLFFVAIGENNVREILYSMIKNIGGNMPSIVHPSAIVSETVRIGAGSIVMPGAVINASTEIGHGSIVNTLASVDHDCMVGNFVHLGPRCALAGFVTVGDNSFCGIGSVLIPRISVGQSCTLGAGSVVIRNVGDGQIVTGVPARLMVSSQ